MRFAIEADVVAGLDRLRRSAFDAAVLCLPSAEYSDEESLDELLRQDSQLPVIVYHPFGTVDDAIRLTRRGAFYVLLGHVDNDRLEAALNMAAHKPRLARAQRDTEPWRRFLIGESPAIRQICDVIQLIGGKRCTVLVTGETGTGKEVIARAIHMASNRAHLPMVAVNCTALPSNLIETELFGHTKGAFTGAHTSRIGRFEQAHRSTLFLDEIGDLPLPAQAKLLRVLQEQEFQRVGSCENVHVDVRVIAASNADLEQAVRENRFREDLFYRLNVVPVHLPALRERREDIPLLLDYFVDKICRSEDTPLKRISPEAVSYLMEMDWPGNVRQLEHSVQVAVAMSNDREMLYPGDFPVRRAASVHRTGGFDEPLVRVPEEGLDFDEVVTSFERSLLNQALTVSGGNKARAADLLRIKRTTLLSKMKTFDDRFAEETPRKPMGKAASATALVVEKDGAVRKFIARTLMAEGYRVLEAAASSGALELFNCWRKDIAVVVTGVEVPGMAGDELVRRMRKCLPSLPAVVVADHAFGVPEPEMPQTEIVPRPFTPEDLMAAVTSLIAGRMGPAVRVACA
ncbi:MAG TPA: sigma 54-interacting transcriptional regulator [Bryobacteraceae bacterium]|nr:sigma 54-interacting transcriptional regulator [Bryobacteraceae bacterium]